jgi:[phosphatase 2A protein]-leucine-carboxy methyltransferase
MFAPSSTDSDAPIRQTDSDATLARLSATQKGYVDDPFIAQFVPRARFQPPRPPLINVGTHARGVGLDALVRRWLDITAVSASSLSEKAQVQIVSLGAGSDTRFWRLAVRNASIVCFFVADDF